MANLHDETVAHLAAEIQAIVEQGSRWVVATCVRWQAMREFPECIKTYDIAILPAGSGLASGKTLVPPREVPVTLVDVITPECNYESEFYDKPDVLLQTSVSEYCLLDPTNEVMRPCMMGHRKSLLYTWERLKSSSYGVFFSKCGFRLDVRGPMATVSPCGPPGIEEKLFACRNIREQLILKGNLPDEGFDEQIRKLESKLKQPRNRGDE